MAVAATCLLGTIACDPACRPIFVYGLNVVIIDGAKVAETGEGGRASSGECRAVVIVKDGDYTEELMCRADGVDCTCSGGHSHAGKYVVTAELDGKTESQKATVRDAGCHVEPVDLTFFDEEEAGTPGTSS